MQTDAIIGHQVNYLIASEDGSKLPANKALELTASAWLNVAVFHAPWAIEQLVTQNGDRCTRYNGRRHVVAKQLFFAYRRLLLGILLFGVLNFLLLADVLGTFLTHDEPP